MNKTTLQNLNDRLHDVEIYVTSGRTEDALELINRLINDTQSLIEKAED